jgi:adenylate cyclase, class 2
MLLNEVTRRHIVLEIEMKFRCADWAAVQKKLSIYQSVVSEPSRDVDHYFNAPDRDFAVTDEVVRLRRASSRHVLTYKGPKQAAAVKTRVEIELPLAEGPDVSADAVRFLSGLGFRPIAVVSKTRTTYTFQRNGFNIHTCFDDVGAIGKFVEVEIVSTPEKAGEARKELAALAAELQLVDEEPRSYLRMLLQTPAPKKA